MNVGRPRKFFTEDELILAKKILKCLIKKPGLCIDCKENSYVYGFYGDGIVAKCTVCGRRRRFIASYEEWGPK